MDELLLYLELGIKHILDINAYDHILFIIALLCCYTIKKIKNLLVIITAFTVGHSITLILSTLDIFSIDKDLIEFVIPLTILFTSLKNTFKPKEPKNIKNDYLLGIVFGTVHGLGFSNYLKNILGSEDNLIKPLLGFNMGIEVGQILILLGLLIFKFLCINIFNISKRDWIIAISSMITGMSISLILT